MSKSQEDANFVYGVALIFSLCFFISVVPGGFFGGNYWCTKDGALGRIQAQNTTAVKVLYINRHIFAESEAMVSREDGTIAKYYLDCNILYNCTVYDKPKKERENK